MKKPPINNCISTALFALHSCQRQAILTLVMNKPRTCAEIVQLTNKPYQCIYDDLQMLVDAGIVEKGSDNRPVYTIFNRNKTHIAVIFENAKRLNRLGCYSKTDDKEEEKPVL